MSKEKALNMEEDKANTQPRLVFMKQEDKLLMKLSMWQVNYIEINKRKKQEEENEDYECGLPRETSGGEETICFFF
ncbi:hypothetical protein PRUPE_2G072400 [Prunus persica]|uniref:Uncharacterized protein n=1 Tax=Prunus persica TaxID=3760 RepID=A0A251QCK3_PRUPE|nr:hypothetical protein PRUPE_2G072400 [Prunus persica]